MRGRASHRRPVVTDPLACVPHPVACLPRHFTGRTGEGQSPEGRSGMATPGEVQPGPWHGLRVPGSAARKVSSVTRGPPGRSRVCSGITWVRKLLSRPYGNRASSSRPGGRQQFAGDFLPQHVWGWGVRVLLGPRPWAPPAATVSCPCRGLRLCHPSPLAVPDASVPGPHGASPAPPRPRPLAPGAVGSGQLSACCALHPRGRRGRRRTPKCRPLPFTAPGGRLWRTPEPAPSASRPLGPWPPALLLGDIAPRLPLVCWVLVVVIQKCWGVSS